ncbi:hypothetical protein HPG69_014739 [Diceros bicornis minor]|uniref:Uncharacterized protein n=1 Tax=Diceros bicornis minor TaxID=77932 RepID=A0A7J7EL10_DICBM|nr:hypothetical protein HPG69_014739 [Diceros bicornis minor]
MRNSHNQLHLSTPKRLQITQHANSNSSSQTMNNASTNSSVMATSSPTSQALPPQSMELENYLKCPINSHLLTPSTFTAYPQNYFEAHIRLYPSYVKATISYAFITSLIPIMIFTYSGQEIIISN